MVKVDLTVGKWEILRNILRREIQRIMAREYWLGNETCNIDKAAWVLSIYDTINEVI